MIGDAEFIELKIILIGWCNTMLKTVSGKKVSRGDIVVIKSIKYIKQAYPEHIPFSYPKDMERDVCGGICIVENVYSDGLLRLNCISKNKNIYSWCIGVHMVEPISEKDIISLDKEQIMKIINYI